MPRKAHESRTSIARQIVEIDVKLCSQKLTPGERRELEKARARLERRLYGDRQTH